MCYTEPNNEGAHTSVAVVIVVSLLVDGGDSVRGATPTLLLYSTLDCPAGYGQVKSTVDCRLAEKIHYSLVGKLTA